MTKLQRKRGGKLLKILELFGGIGAPRKALENIGVNIKSIDYVEILPHAVAAYNQIFTHEHIPQDVKSWNLNVDLLVHGSPCQDWSKNGLNDVSTGRSILYERTLEIIEHELTPRPKIVIWENVTGLISKRHIDHFNHYLATMERLGYSNKFKVLNSRDYGMPQSRERIFTVSILGDYDFEFPEPQPLTRHLSEFIDRKADITEYALSDNEMSLFFEQDGQLYIHANTARGRQEVYDGDSINVERPNSKTRRGRVQRGMVPTLTTSPNVAVYYDGIIRKITPRECWRLLGFTDADYDRVSSAGLPKAALYKLPGNSIVVPTLEAIFKALITQGYIKEAQ